MGCGNHSSIGRSSGGIIVVSSSIRHQSPLGSIHLASDLQVKMISINENFESNSHNKTSEEQLPVQSGFSSLIKPEKKDENIDLSKIPFEDQDPNRHCTIRLRSPTEIVNRLDHLHPSQGFNFDFLNESSSSDHKKKTLINTALKELESVEP